MGGGFDQHWEKVRSAVLVGTWIWSSVSWFRWQSIEAVWHGFRETVIHVRRITTGIIEPQGPYPRLRPFMEGLGLLLGVWDAPLWGMLIGPNVFLCSPGVFGLRPCNWTYLKHRLSNTAWLSSMYDYLPPRKLLLFLV